MTEQHPIPPPPELVQEWWEAATPGISPSVKDQLCTQAAQWGADQELEACLLLVGEGRRENLSQVIALRNARRPKPPSLKEQALSELEEIMTELHDKTGSAFTASTIRRALEALDD